MTKAENRNTNTEMIPFYADWLMARFFFANWLRYSKLCYDSIDAAAQQADTDNCQKKRILVILRQLKFFIFFLLKDKRMNYFWRGSIERVLVRLCLMHDILLKRKVSHWVQGIENNNNNKMHKWRHLKGESTPKSKILERPAEVFILLDCFGVKEFWRRSRDLVAQIW